MRQKGGVIWDILIDLALANKFRELGSIKDAPRSGRPPLGGDKQFEIVAQFVEDPQQSTRLVAKPSSTIL
ncbi:hypothetical protein J6590_086589 [Homalodisca vitripennis]|nr:hypothetical protein J6590_086589 [Homalodisca vitripennis]